MWGDGALDAPGLEGTVALAASLFAGLLVAGGALLIWPSRRLWQRFLSALENEEP
jgi:hypothetical protein